MPVKYDKLKVIRPEMNISWTREMIQEFSECSKDVKYFALNQCKVRGVKGIIPLQLRDYQMKMLETITDNEWSVLKTGRQVGKSTIVGLYCLWNAIFAHPKKPVEIWILSNKASSAQSFLDDIKGTYEELDPFIKSNAGVIEWNKTSIEFENKSRIITSTTAKDAIRGETPNFVVLDEFAHVAAHIAEEFYKAVWPSISSGGRIIVISTPNGNTNKFYDLFHNATDGPDANGFGRFDMDWREVPDRDEAFKEKQIKATSLQEWNQEFEAKFLGSSNTLVSGEHLEKMARMTQEPMYEYEDMVLWEKPRKDNLYVISCDVAKGVQKDSSVMQILNVTNRKVSKQVGVWSSNEIDPFDFTEKINEIARMFNDAFVIIENNTYGHEVCRRLFDEFEYENIYKERKKKFFGVTADKKKKVLGTSYLKKHLEQNKLVINDKGTYDELCNFIEVNPDVYRCSSGKNSHDDRVMSLLWGVFLLETDFWNEWAEYLREQLSDKIEGREPTLEEIYDPIICEQTDGPVFDDDGFREDGWVLG
jgi:hypothetical protein